jgi:hypothetical protein
MAQRRSKQRSDNIFRAALEGSVEDVRGMIAAGTHPDDREEADDPTPLVAAAATGRLDVVEALVQAGADVNIVVDDLSGELDQFPFLDELFAVGRLSGITPLTHAVLYRQERVRDYLAPLTATQLRSEAGAIRDVMARQVVAVPRPYGAAKQKPKSASQTARDNLLAASAAARRWIWSCPLCGRQGYKPALPERIDRRETAAQLRRMYQPLTLSKDRICERCTEKIAAAMTRVAQKRQKKLASLPPESRAKLGAMAKKKPSAES